MWAILNHKTIANRQTLRQIDLLLASGLPVTDGSPVESCKERGCIPVILLTKELVDLSSVSPFSVLFNRVACVVRLICGAFLSVTLFSVAL